MKISIPIKVKVHGKITLGPVPGTPEFAEEQRCKTLGVEYCPGKTSSDEPPDTARSGE
jgi:hypothetical protein